MLERLRQAAFVLTHDTHVVEVPEPGQATFLLLTSDRHGTAQLREDRLERAGVSAATVLVKHVCSGEDVYGFVNIKDDGTPYPSGPMVVQRTPRPLREDSIEACACTDECGNEHCDECCDDA